MMEVDMHPRPWTALALGLLATGFGFVAVVRAPREWWKRRRTQPLERAMWQGVIRRQR